ncbi:hypothetical protein I551_2501 [Mycobacterium ulcerans str. Harvey]|uniref:Uncharacterized protein n=1 Tax=Mycobacterium ulcerans str. Harvey TaxID=1299332 RepID=A0ABP3AM92_MYCUL|nr:hypothetical protein I551_2501 [Mycobacterium ulcerans str. Harvey]
MHDMALPNQHDHTTGSDTDATPIPDHTEDRPPQILTLRIAPLDVILTVAFLGALLVVVTTTSWPSQLFAFSQNVCISEDCPLCHSPSTITSIRSCGAASARPWPQP